MNSRRNILILTVAILVLAVLAGTFRHFQLRWDLEAYVSRLKAAGEPLDLAKVIPPNVPPGMNSTAFITNSLSRLYAIDDAPSNLAIDLTIYNPPGEMNRTIPGKEMIGWNEPVIHGPNSNYPTNSWADMATQLAERKDEFVAFRKLISQPSFDFNFDYANPYNNQRKMMLDLSAIKQANQWLEASEYYQLHLGNTQAACTDVRAMLAFVKGQTDERLEICQLIRCALAGMSAGATWDILQTTNVTDEDLEQLQQDWQSLDFLTPMTGAFQFERVSSIRFQDALRRFHADLLDFARLPSTSFVVKSKKNGKWTDWDGSSTNFYMIDQNAFEQGQRSFFRRMTEVISESWHYFVWWPAFYSYEDELRGLREWQVMFTATRMAENNTSFISVQSFVNTNFFRVGFAAAEGNPYAIFSRNAYQVSALRKAVRAEVARNIVVTAIALKRYQVRHHHLPNTLEELVPVFLKSVPMDCMDGQPLHYQRNTNDSFLLYSVGENGKDDGGNPAWESTHEITDHYDWQSAHALDWVWPQQATQDEIRAFFSRHTSGD